MHRHDTRDVSSVMSVRLSAELPPEPQFDPSMRRAPDRGYNLSRAETIVAVKNALRYVPPELHAALAPEFLQELKTRGRIYGYRFRPQGRIYAKPVDEYEGKTLAGRALQVMIDNNLAFANAHPFQDATGDVIMAWMLLWRASVATEKIKKAKKKDKPFYDGLLKSLQFFVESYLPLTMGNLNALTTLGSAAIDIDEASFPA